MPRGHRNPESGEWLWALHSRPSESYLTNSVEGEAVALYKDLVNALTNARYERDLSVRSLASAAGVSSTALSELESGSAWPRLSTVAKLAAVLNLWITIDGRADLAKALRLKARANYAQPRRERTSSVEASAVAGVSISTYYGLKARDPRMSSVLGLCAALECEFAVAPVADENDPQPVPGWGSQNGS